MIRFGNKVDGTPYIVGGECPEKLERIHLNSNELLEKTIQEVIEKCPDILPFSDIDISFGSFAHLCREYKTQNGPIDHVLLGEHGEICLIETKLWRNPEARRKVIGQIIDYGSALRGMTYTDFEESVKRHSRTNKSLFEIHKSAFGETLPEEVLVDSVSRTLSEGSFLLMIVGDGIRSEIIEMKNYLDNFPGNLSTLALVELRAYKHEGKTLFLPLLVTKTVEIGRTILDIKDKTITAKIGKESDTESKETITVTNGKTLEINELVSEINKKYGKKPSGLARQMIDDALANGFELRTNTKNIRLGALVQTSSCWAFRDLIVIWGMKNNYVNFILPKEDNWSDLIKVPEDTYRKTMEGIKNLVGEKWNQNKSEFIMYDPLISNTNLIENWPKIFELILEFYKAGTIEP